MAALLEKTWKAYLDEERFWSYQEMLTEVVAVLWISTSVSAELVKRYFPDWPSTRMDPNNTDSIGILWKLLGYGQDSCFWVRAVSFWKISNNFFCQNDSDLRPSPSCPAISVGYAGTYATMTATAILYILFFYSLFVNRQWRRPTRNLTVYALHEMMRMFDYPRCTLLVHTHPPTQQNTAATSGTDGSHPEKEEAPPPRYCDLFLNGQFAGCSASVPATRVHAAPQQEATPQHCTDQCVYDDKHRERSSDSSYPGVASFIGMLALGFVPGVPVAIAVVILWLIVLILPVPVLATLTAWSAVRIVGEEAVLPSYMLLALSLTIYSVGRMAGLWMRSNYLFGIWNTLKKFKGVSSGEQVTKAPFQTVVDQASQFTALRCFGYGLPTVCFSYYMFWSLIGGYSSLARLRKAANETDSSNTTDIQALTYWTIRVAYWENSSALQDAGVTFTKDESLLSQADSEVPDLWLHLATGAAMLVLLPTAFVFWAGFIFRLAAMNRLEKQHRSNPENKLYPKWYTCVYDRRPQSAWCWCTETMDVVWYSANIGLPMFAMLLLPFPFLEWTVPEQYHIPGLVLMVTGGAMATLYAEGQWLWANWCVYKRHPHDPLGGKLRCGYHPLCYRYLNVRAGQRTSTEGKQSTTEKPPMISTAIETTVQTKK